MILASQESEQDEVQSAYEHYLHRSADPTGLAGWLAQLQHGMTDQTLAADFLGSGEYFDKM